MTIQEYIIDNMETMSILPTDTGRIPEEQELELQVIFHLKNKGFVKYLSGCYEEITNFEEIINAKNAYEIHIGKYNSNYVFTSSCKKYHVYADKRDLSIFEFEEIKNLSFTASMTIQMLIKNLTDSDVIEDFTHKGNSINITYRSVRSHGGELTLERNFAIGKSIIDVNDLIFETYYKFINTL